jgi:hypothetical protein
MNALLAQTAPSNNRQAPREFYENKKETLKSTNRKGRLT